MSPKTYWLCELFHNGEPSCLYMSDEEGPMTTMDPDWAIQYPTKEQASNQCPPGFFPTEHADA
jgi:hypothetical protein